MKNIHVLCKLGNMRKLADFIVYPQQAGSTSIMIQSDTRICKFDPATGMGVLSAAHQNGSYFVDLHPARGATVIAVPQDVIDACVQAAPQKGDQVAPCLFIG